MNKDIIYEIITLLENFEFYSDPKGKYSSKEDGVETVTEFKFKYTFYQLLLHALDELIQDYVNEHYIAREKYERIARADTRRYISYLRMKEKFSEVKNYIKQQKNLPKKFLDEDFWEV